MTHQTPTTPASGPLAGLRIIDLTTVVLGPYATQILGDFGADIIKIEAPSGDTTRYTGPAANPGMAALFMGCNRNKRSVVIDLKSEQGRSQFLELVKSADGFIHNVRPQKLEKLGLGPKALLKLKPGLVYVGIHGFCEDGPYAGKPAYDDIIQGASGVASLMGRLTGEPMYAPTILADKTCGLVAAQAMLAGLLHKQRTGEGQFIEVPMFESMVSFVMTEHLYGATFDPPRGPTCYSRVLAPFRKPYKTADGSLCVMAYTDAQWLAYWQAAGIPEKADDPRFADMSLRSENIEALYELAGMALVSRPTQYWVREFERLEVPCMPVNEVDDLLRDPHLMAIGHFESREHPTEGRLVFSGQPIRFSRSPASIHRLPPRLGEHTQEVLGAIHQAKV